MRGQQPRDRPDLDCVAGEQAIVRRSLASPAVMAMDGLGEQDAVGQLEAASRIPFVLRTLRNGGPLRPPTNGGERQE